MIDETINKTINDVTLWSTIALLASGTFAIRVSLIAMSDRINVTGKHREFFSYIPAAIIPAIVVPMVYFHNGSVSLLGGKERLAVMVFAAAVCWWTRSMLATIAAGLLLLYVLRSMSF